MTRQLDENQKYYDDKKYDGIYKNLMIHDKNEAIPVKKYYEDKGYNVHFQNVHAGIDDGKTYDENVRYYDDKDMNELFINKFVKDTIEEVETEEELIEAITNPLIKTVRLVNNVSVSTNLIIDNGSEKIFDLNEKVMTYSGTANLKVGGNDNTHMGTGGTLTFKNGTLNLGSKALRVYANNSATDRETVIKSKIILGENFNLNSTSTSPIGIMGKGAELYVDADCGTIETTGTNAALIIGNGNPQCSGTKITINGGTFKAGNDNGSVVIYHPQAGELTINGGTFEGADGIQLKAGNASTATISNATIKGTYTVAVDPATITDTSTGSVTTGSAISLIGNADYTGSMSLVIDGNVVLESVNNPALIQAVTNTNPNIEKVIINNGSFTGKGFDGNNKAVLIKNYTTIQDKVFIYAGTYNSDVSEYLKPDFECVEVSTGVWKVQAK